jgi:hypothetical protein
MGEGAPLAKRQPRRRQTPGEGEAVSASAYGRPWSRRVHATFYPGILCSLCDKPVRSLREFTLDHVTPVAYGGANGPVKPAH